MGASDSGGDDTHKVLFIKMWILKNVVLIKIHPDEKRAAVDAR